jgi:hypothetical protein
MLLFYLHAFAQWLCLKDLSRRLKYVETQLQFVFEMMLKGRVESSSSSCELKTLAGQNVIACESLWKARSGDMNGTHWFVRHRLFPRFLLLIFHLQKKLALEYKEMHPEETARDIVSNVCSQNPHLGDCVARGKENTRRQNKVISFSFCVLTMLIGNGIVHGQVYGRTVSLEVLQSVIINKVKDAFGYAAKQKKRETINITDDSAPGVAARVDLIPFFFVLLFVPQFALIVCPVFYCSKKQNAQLQSRKSVQLNHVWRTRTKKALWRWRRFAIVVCTKYGTIAKTRTFERSASVTEKSKPKRSAEHLANSNAKRQKSSALQIVTEADTATLAAKFKSNGQSTNAKNMMVFKLVNCLMFVGDSATAQGENVLYFSVRVRC